MNKTTMTFRFAGFALLAIAGIAQAQHSAGSAEKFVSVSNDDETITVFGNTAIARGATHNTMADASGKTWEIKSHFTDVWVKMPNGKWQCVSSQGSPLVK